MYGCESWTIKKAECWRIDAFELWCWRRFLRVPWAARRSNQSILKEVSPGCSLEGLMLKLKLQYLGHLMWRADSFEKTLMLGKIEGRRRRGRQRISWLDGITDSMDVVWVNSGHWWWTGRPGVLRFMGLQKVGHDWATELNWTDSNIKGCYGGGEWQEYEIVGWHHWLNGREFQQAPGDSEGQGSLVCYSPWGCKESDTTEQLNNNGTMMWLLCSTLHWTVFVNYAESVKL